MPKQAWETCPYCQQRFNGYINLRSHKDEKHPGKMDVEAAQSKVKTVESILKSEQERKAVYEFLDAALRDGLVPGPAIAYFEEERSLRAHEYPSDASTAIEVFARQIVKWQERLAKAQAELAALEKAEVTHA